MSSSIEDSIEVIARNTYGTWRPQKAWKKPLYITNAEGVYFYDSSGKRYLDFSSQLMCSNLGHKNMKLIEALCEQAKTLPYVSPGFACEVKASASKALLKVMPEGLEKYFYSTSGTEANEAAVKIVRMYYGHSGKYKIISRYQSYHGSTAAAIALTGDIRRWYAEPVNKIPGTVLAPDAYCYRCPFKLEYPRCGITCAEYVDYMIKNEGNVAAIIVEPVVGTNGVLVPPKEYLPRLREIADENNVLFIADEVMSGWFRTGEWFAVNNWKVKPDIITTAKGCTAAYIPLGITATTRRIADFFEEGFFCHGHTYEAHPLTLSIVPSAIEELGKLNSSGHIKRVGEYLGRRLKELGEKHRSVGDVRGIGFFWAVELVKNRKKKTPFNTRVDKAAMKPLLVDKISSDALNKGVYVMGWLSHLLVAPPLTISEEQVDEGITVLDETLKIADAEAKG